MKNHPVQRITTCTTRKDIVFLRAKNSVYGLMRAKDCKPNKKDGCADGTVRSVMNLISYLQGCETKEKKQIISDDQHQLVRKLIQRQKLEASNMCTEDSLSLLDIRLVHSDQSVFTGLFEPTIVDICKNDVLSFQLVIKVIHIFLNYFKGLMQRKLSNFSKAGTSKAENGTVPERSTLADENEVQCVLDINPIPVKPKKMARRVLKRVSLNENLLTSSTIEVEDIGCALTQCSVEADSNLKRTEDYSSCKITLNGVDVPLQTAIDKLKSELVLKKSFCVKSFLTTNSDIIVKIYEAYKRQDTPTFSLDDICQKIVAEDTTRISISKLKGLFKTTYRRNLIEQIHPQFGELEVRVRSAVNGLEPGEAVDLLWSDTISDTFGRLIMSKYQNINLMTSNSSHRRQSLDKFLDQLFAKKGMWPEGMMTAEFLKNKAHELLQIDIDMVDLPIEKSPSKCRAGNPAGHGKNYKDLDRPSKDIKISDKKGGFDNLTKHWPRKDSDPLHTKNMQLLPLNPTPSKSMQRSSRHRSDESQTDSHSHSHHKRSISPRRKKRHSNESCIRDRSSVKRPRLEERFVVKEMTDYDKKLQSFKIWDPFRNVTEMALKEVFQTKEGTPETIGPKIPSPSSSYLGRLTSETSASNAPGPSIGPQTEAAATSSMIDQIEDQNNTKETNENKEILDKSALSKGKEKLISKSADQQESEDSSKMKSEVLRDRYGDIDIKLEDTASDSVSVVITIQGYFFEGVAPTQNEALEDASCKALLLAPYILHKL